MSDDEELVDYENLNPPVGRLIKLLNQNNEAEDGWTSDEEEQQENSINSTSDANQAYNPNVNGISSQAVGNTPSFSNTEIRPSRFAGPAINSGFVGQARNAWNNRFPVNNQGSDAVQPSANTQFATASRFMGPREFRGTRPGIETSRRPVINHTVEVNRMPVIEAKRPPFNIRPTRAQLLNRPIVPSLSPVDIHSQRPPVATKPVDEVNKNYFLKPSSRPLFPIGSRPIRPNLFPRAQQNSGGIRFPTPESFPPFGQGMDMNLNPHGIKGARTPFAAQDDKTKLETRNAASLPKLPSIVSKNPSKEEEEEPEAYDSEGDYEQGEHEYDVDQETISTNEPPALPPPRLPPSRFPVAGLQPRFAMKPIPSGYPAPMGTNAFRYPKSVEAGYHSNENIRPTVSEPIKRASATDEVEDHNTQNEPLPSMSSRTPSTSFQPSTTSWSSPRSSDNTDHRSSSTSTESPLPPSLHPKFSQALNIRPQPASTTGGRKRSQEGVPPSNILDDTRGIRTITDLEGYEQIQGFGDGSSSSLIGPRFPAVARGTRPSFTPPMMARIRPMQNTRFPPTQTKLLSLENGDSFESTPFYESILREDYFHLISQQEVPRRLTHDGMFLFQPSSSRNDSNPLTLWLRYCGQNRKFAINRRDDGKFAIGAEKENEDRFYSISEMASHYYHTPLKFEGRQMYFEKNAPKPM